MSYLALFNWITPNRYLASKVIMPLAQMTFFVFLGTYATGQDNASFYVIGNAMQLTAINGIYGVTFSVGGERRSGTLPYLFGAPANRLVVFVGRAFMHVIDGFFGVIIGFFWGRVLFDLDLSHTNPWALLLTILITTISTSGLGLIMGCISLISLNVLFVNNTV
ncbi:MAG: hypothetical protein N2D54_03265, partial [Chloroflexota bacterium]